jgi:hypothetical protein
MMNSDLQNKLYHFEADPPKEVWNRIDDALDAGQTFPQRLYQYEEQPPLQSWEAIEASLEKVNESFKVFPLTKYKKPVRYVAAAASIIFAIVLITNFTDNKNGAGAAIGGTETTATTNQSSILPLEKTPVLNDVTTRHDVAINFSNEKEKSGQTHGRKIFTTIHPQALRPYFSFSKNFIPGKADKEALFDFSILDSYMVYSDGDGNAMKLPKKLFSLVNCQDGDESCKERVHQLQQIMASSAATTDFAGILEILRELQ